MRQYCTSGFAVIEVMVSLVLITASVMSMVVISAHTQTATRDAANEHTAWVLAVELAAWLRAGGTQPLGNPPANLLEQIQGVNAPADCYALACTSLDAANFYLWHWRRRLMKELPGARVVLCREGLAMQAGSFRWRWSCPSNADDSSLWLIKLGWPDHPGSTHFDPRVVLPVGQIR